MRNLGSGRFYGNPGTMPGTPSSLLYRLKMILGGISPMIWCRLLVPADMILYGLRRSIQFVLGWEDYHLSVVSPDGRPPRSGVGQCRTWTAPLWDSKAQQMIEALESVRR